MLMTVLGAETHDLVKISNVVLILVQLYGLGLTCDFFTALLTHWCFFDNFHVFVLYSIVFSLHLLFKKVY